MLDHEPFPMSFASYAPDHRSAIERDAALQVQTNTVTSSVAVTAPHYTTDENKLERKRQVQFEVFKSIFYKPNEYL